LQILDTHQDTKEEAGEALYTIYTPIEVNLPLAQYTVTSWEFEIEKNLSLNLMNILASP